MLNLYFDCIQREHIDIDMPENQVNFYIIKTNDTENQEKYKLCATTEDLNKLSSDPETRKEKYWPIPSSLIQKNNDLLFEFQKDEDCLESISSLTNGKPWRLMKNTPMSLETTRQLFDIDLSQIEPLTFGNLDIEGQLKFNLIYLLINHNQIKEAGMRLMSIIDNSSLTNEEKINLYKLTYEVLQNKEQFGEKFSAQTDKLFTDALRSLAIDALLLGGVFSLAYFAQLKSEQLFKIYGIPFISRVLPTMLLNYFDNLLAFRQSIFSYFSYPGVEVVNRILFVLGRLTDRDMFKGLILKGMNNISKIGVAIELSGFKTEFEHQKKPADELINYQQQF